MLVSGDLSGNGGLISHSDARPPSRWSTLTFLLIGYWVPLILPPHTTFHVHLLFVFPTQALSHTLIFSLFKDFKNLLVGLAVSTSTLPGLSAWPHGASRRLRDTSTLARLWLRTLLPSLTHPTHLALLSLSVGKRLLGPSLHLAQSPGTYRCWISLVPLPPLQRQENWMSSVLCFMKLAT